MDMQMSSFVTSGPQMFGVSGPKCPQFYRHASSHTHTHTAHKIACINSESHLNVNTITVVVSNAA